MKEKNQERILEFYSLNQKVKQIQEQLELLKDHVKELMVLEESIKELNKGKKQIYMPLGGGVFVEAEVKNNKSLLVNVGSNVLLNKTPKDANELVQKQQKEIFQAIASLDSELKESIKELKILQKEISKEEQQ